MGLVIVILVLIIWVALAGHSDESDNNSYVGNSNDAIYLLQSVDNSYRESNDSREYDKKLVWDNRYQSYYDADSYCYVCYNKNVSPHVWQYWYEGISSDYGDYGWMEYRSGRWYIEQYNDHWIVLPSDYRTSHLWHIE